MEFFRPEYWTGWSFPSPEDLPNPGIEPRSPALQLILYHLSHQGSPRMLEWDLPSRYFPGIKPGSPALQVDSLPTKLSVGATREAL